MFRKTFLRQQPPMSFATRRFSAPFSHVSISSIHCTWKLSCVELSPALPTFLSSLASKSRSFSLPIHQLHPFLSMATPSEPAGWDAASMGLHPGRATSPYADCETEEARDTAEDDINDGSTTVVSMHAMEAQCLLMIARHPHHVPSPDHLS